MAYKDKERTKEYQKQYYWNRTKLRRATGELKVKSYYKKKTEEEKAQNRANGAKKRLETLREKLGDEGMSEYFYSIGKRGQATLRAEGKPIGFQAGYAKEAQKLGAKARGLKSKHKKVRAKYEGE